MEQDQPSPDGLDAAREFAQAVPWTYASTFAAFAEHEYVTRWTCRERRLEAEFERFCELVTDRGYWRDWGRHRWRTLDLDDRFYWLHYNPVDSVAERTVLNRWFIAERREPAQMSLDFAQAMASWRREEDDR